MTSTYQYQFPGFPDDFKCPSKGMKDVFHAYMTRGVTFEETAEMPIMQSEHIVPKGLVSFSEAMEQRCKDFDCYVHFFENDCQIERFWNAPWKYMDRLSMFSGFISPDYSSTPDMKRPQRQFNTYRNQLVGAWFQSLGYHAICNVRSPAFGHDYSLAGAPRHSLIAIGSVGCVKNRADRRRFEGGLIRLIDTLDPSGLVICGSDSYDVFDYAKEREIPLHFYSGQTQKYFEGDGHER